MTLLKTAELMSLYNDARYYRDRENPSLEFWVQVLYHFFPAPRFNHAREFAPLLDDPTDQRKIDITQRKWVRNKKRYFTNGIAEGKRPNYNQADIDKVEQQLLEYSSAYVNGSEETSLWGFTTLGTAIRIWFYKEGDSNLTAYCPQTTAYYHAGAYIDADARDTTELETAFKYIAENPWPTKKTRGISPDIPSPTPTPSANPFSGTTVPALYASTGSSSTTQPSYSTTTDTSTYYADYTTTSIGSTSANVVPVFRSADALVDCATRIASPSEEGSPGYGAQGETAPRMPSDAIFVTVEVEITQRGEQYHFSYNDLHYIKSEEDWVARTTVVNGEVFDCVVCTGKKSGLNFWTYDLRNLASYKQTKGKGKSKR